MRRSAPVILVTLGLLALLGSYVWYTQRVVDELGREARQTAEVVSRVYAAAAAPTPAGNDAVLFEVITALKGFGVPMIVTDSAGRPTAVDNLPFEHSGPGDPRVAAYIDVLDRQNPPVGDPSFQLVHFGRSRLATGLNVIPLLQVALVAILIIVGAVVLRTRGRVERERVWAGMAREAAHQLGTPLSSLHGWVELLRDRAGGDGSTESALLHVASDVERLERVAHRFERIGRPPRRDAVNVSDLAAQVAGYFRQRLPTLAHPITIGVDGTSDALTVPGDRVLLEWAVESLVKNAIDALSGRGGTITLSASLGPGGGAVLRVADDGPGIPDELRRKVFAAGFSTKESGWGIGLALARRIVEEAHRGRLTLVRSDRGAVFEI
ncbi:MAG: HAMP domain-containing sensor histidine kinase, partial [Gemmatimonadota bacterium]|nr:HAMP domain-containing sensor histidine kinase [Gemmatimonadota bacterium]